MGNFVLLLMEWIGLQKADIKFIFYDIAYGNGKYVVVGYQSYIAVLTNDFKVESYKWIKDTIDDCWKSIILGNGKFAVVGDRYGRTSSSADGINWTPVKQESGIGVTYGNGKYVSVGNGSISVSADGEYWKRATIQMVVVIIELLLLIRTGSL